MMIILIPGLMNDGWVWHGQVGPLSRIAPVMIARTDGCDSLAAMAKRVVDSTSGPLALVGHSMGGRVALEIVAQAPERVKAVALLNTGAGGPNAHQAAGRETLMEIARTQGMAKVAESWLPPMLAPANRERAPLISEIVAMLERCTPAIFAAQQQALIERPDRMPLLREIACPLLAVAGSEDEWAPVAQHRAMAEAAPQGRLHVIEGAGHMMPVEAPEALAAVLCDFFSGL